MKWNYLFITLFFKDREWIEHFTANTVLISYHIVNTWGAMKNILVAEDNEFNFFVIEALLLSKKMDIIRASNGEEAVNYFKALNNICLILMDIQMPVMDGFTATEEIRKLDKNVPIVVQTSYDLDRVKEKAFEAGCNDFIVKPLSVKNLIPVVEKYVD